MSSPSVKPEDIRDIRAQIARLVAELKALREKVFDTLGYQQEQLMDLQSAVFSEEGDAEFTAQKITKPTPP